MLTKNKKVYTCGSCGASFSRAAEYAAHLAAHGEDGEAIDSAEYYRALALAVVFEVSAQDLYDLREMTGFISGQDLHELFDAVVGEPSPSGYRPVNVLALTESDAGRRALELLSNRGLDLVKRTREYLLW